MSFRVRTGRREIKVNNPMTENIVRKSKNIRPKIMMEELRKKEAGRAILKMLSIGESLAEMVLNRYVSIIISAEAAPIRVTKKSIDQIRMFLSVKAERKTVAIPIMAKPIAMIFFWP